MSKKQKQYNCRAGINGWHENNCPHQNQPIGSTCDDTIFIKPITPAPQPAGLEEILREVIGVGGMPCCKVCQCENGKKVWCACHRDQLRQVFIRYAQKAKQEERKILWEQIFGLLIDGKKWDAYDFLRELKRISKL